MRSSYIQGDWRLCEIVDLGAVVRIVVGWRAWNMITGEEKDFRTLGKAIAFAQGLQCQLLTKT